MILAASNNPVKPQGYFSRYFSHPDPTMEDSVHKSLQTLFYPQKGIHRSIANGLEPTGITYYQGSVTMSTNPTNNIISFVAIPALVAKTAVEADPGFLQWTAFVNILNPIGAVGSARISGPFASPNPMIDGRIVTFTMNFIPSSTVLERGGAGKLAYASDYQSIGWSASDFDNLAISRAWDGTESMTLHWVPGVNEYDFGSGTNIVSSFSALTGYITVPLGEVCSWRVEWQVGIEYNPTAVYRPLIDRKVPLIRPDARYFVNQVVQKHWSPLMICSYANFLHRLEVAESLGGYSDIHAYIDHAGMGGLGFRNVADADILSEGFSDAEEEKTNGFGGVVNAVKNQLCDTLIKATGEDVCGQPLRSAINLGARAYGGFGRRSSLRQLNY